MLRASPPHYLLGLLALSACDRPSVASAQNSGSVAGTANSTAPAGDLKPSEACWQALTALAMANPRTNTIAANFAGPLGLVPSSDPEATPYISKQTEFALPDGSMHYFAIDRHDWTKALLIWTESFSPNSPVLFYVVDRRGTLIAAARIHNRELVMADIRDRAVLSRFETERRGWAQAGPAGFCH